LHKRFPDFAKILPCGGDSQVPGETRVVSSVWEAIGQLSLQNQVFFAFALLIAFAFEFINGFHDTANAVTTVIYTGTLKPMPAVIYSGFCNFLGVLRGGTAVDRDDHFAFGGGSDLESGDVVVRAARLELPHADRFDSRRWFSEQPA